MPNSGGALVPSLVPLNASGIFQHMRREGMRPLPAGAFMRAGSPELVSPCPSRNPIKMDSHATELPARFPLSLPEGPGKRP